MAFSFTHPLRVVWRYMRGDDITENNARTLARNQAERAASAADRPEGQDAAAVSPPVTVPVSRSAARP